jgi:hypothetical protein
MGNKSPKSTQKQTAQKLAGATATKQKSRTIASQHFDLFRELAHQRRLRGDPL